MNKLHSFTKIIIMAMGIFFVTRLIPQILTYLYSIPILKRAENHFETTTLMFISFIVSAIYLFVICYLFMYKRERLASMIVGKDEPSEPDIQIQWLPVAFRLVCIFAGMYCLLKVFSGVISTFSMYFYIQSYDEKIFYKYFNISQITGWIILLTIGIYLVCGAPHFVRWQVKKTLELCKNQSGIKTYSSS